MNCKVALANTAKVIAPVVTVAPVVVAKEAQVKPAAATTTTSISAQLSSIAQQVNQQMNAVQSAANAAAVAAAAATALANSNSSNDSVNLTENQKKLLGMTSADDPSASLEQQVELTLKGKEQRLILMEKLMRRKQDSRVIVLKNMVGPEDVDDDLEVEITGK
jgi:poly(U)-binding-splicing factor PUF60